MFRVANAPCSWGVLEFDRAGPTLPYARVLDEMAAAGYAGTELGDFGFLPTEPATLRDELGRRELALLGAFVPVALMDARAHAAAADSATRVAKLMAAVSNHAPLVVISDATARDPYRTRVAGRVKTEDRLDERGLDTLAGGAELIARRVLDTTGLRTVFHHHCATFVETPAEIDAVMTRTDPALIGLCLDTGHVTFGGGDPARTAARWRDRIGHVHLKDCDPRVRQRAAIEEWDYPRSVREGVFCELGRGSVDFPAVLAELRQNGYDGWLVVEQDVLPSTGTPAESAARNREYLRLLGV